MNLRKWSINRTREIVDDRRVYTSQILYDNEVVGVIGRKNIHPNKNLPKDTFCYSLKQPYESALLFDTNTRDIRVAIDCIMREELRRYQELYDDYLKLKDEVL